MSPLEDTTFSAVGLQCSFPRRTGSPLSRYQISILDANKRDPNVYSKKYTEVIIGMHYNYAFPESISVLQWSITRMTKSEYGLFLAVESPFTFGDWSQLMPKTECIDTCEWINPEKHSKIFRRYTIIDNETIIVTFVELLMGYDGWAYDVILVRKILQTFGPAGNGNPGDSS